MLPQEIRKIIRTGGFDVLSVRIHRHDTHNETGLGGKMYDQENNNSNPRCHTYGDPQVIIYKILPFLGRRQFFPLLFLPDTIFLFQVAVSLPFLKSSV